MVTIAGLFNGPIFEREALHGRTAVIGWWESRRFFYNKIVGAAGIVTCILMISCAAISELIGKPIDMPEPTILVPFAIIAYGIVANLCFTGGWIAELLLARFRPETRTDLFGLRAFRMGVKFSIAITILPAALCWGMFLF